MEAFGLSLLKDDVNSKFSSNLELSDCICPICMYIIIQPVTMPCGHELCLPCFNAHVHGTSLQCPMCRKRIASWARKGARNGKLVNEIRWKQIQTAFPKKVQCRLDGIEDSDEEVVDGFLELDKTMRENHLLQGSRWVHRKVSQKKESVTQLGPERLAGFRKNVVLGVRHVSEPGEIRKEYLDEIKKLADERERQQKVEEEASERLIQQLQAIEFEAQMNAERQQLDDQALARQLWAETQTRSRSKSPTLMEKFVQKTNNGTPNTFGLDDTRTEAGNNLLCYTPTDTGKIISADMVTTDTYPYVSDDFLKQRGMDAKDVAAVHKNGPKRGAMTDFIYISDSPMCITISETPVEREVKDEGAKLTEGTPKGAGKKKRCASGNKMKEWLSASAVKKKKKDAEATVSKSEPTSTHVKAESQSTPVKEESQSTHLVPDSINRCPSRASVDSISPELNHFRPVRTFPRTPPKQMDDGSLLRPSIVHTKPCYLSFGKEHVSSNKVKGEESVGVNRFGDCPLVRKRLDELRRERRDKVKLLSKGTSMPQSNSRESTWRDTDGITEPSSTYSSSRRQRRYFDTIEEALRDQDSAKDDVIAVKEDTPLLPVLPLEVDLTQAEEHVTLSEDTADMSVADLFQADVSMALYDHVTVSRLKCDDGKSYSDTGEGDESLSNYDVTATDYNEATCSDDVMVSHPYADVIVCGDEVTMTRSDAAKSADLSKIDSTEGKSKVNAVLPSFFQFIQPDSQNVSFQATDENSNSISACFKAIKETAETQSSIVQDVVEFQLPKEFSVAEQAENVERWLESCTESENDEPGQAESGQHREDADILGSRTDCESLGRQGLDVEEKLVGETVDSGMIRGVPDVIPVSKSVISLRDSCERGSDSCKESEGMDSPLKKVVRKRKAIPFMEEDVSPLKIAKPELKSAKAKVKVSAHCDKSADDFRIQSACFANAKTAHGSVVGKGKRKSKKRSGDGKPPPGPSSRKVSAGGAGSRKASSVLVARKRKSSLCVTDSGADDAADGADDAADGAGDAARTRCKTPLKSDRGDARDGSTPGRRRGLRRTPQCSPSDSDVFFLSDYSDTKISTGSRSSRKTPRCVNKRSDHSCGKKESAKKSTVSTDKQSRWLRKSTSKKKVEEETNDNKENSVDSVTCREAEVRAVKRQIFRDSGSSDMRKGKDVVQGHNQHCRMSLKNSPRKNAVSKRSKKSPWKSGNPKSKVENSPTKVNCVSVASDDSVNSKQRCDRKTEGHVRKRSDHHCIEYSPTNKGKVIARKGSKPSQLIGTKRSSIQTKLVLSESKELRLMRSGSDEEILIETKFLSKAKPDSKRTVPQRSKQGADACRRPVRHTSAGEQGQLSTSKLVPIKSRGKIAKGCKGKKMDGFLTNNIIASDHDSEKFKRCGSVGRSSVASSVDSMLEPDDIRLERCEFATDHEYSSYVEEQDRLLALKLQRDFDLEHKYNLNCIKRKGSDDEYQLRSHRKATIYRDFSC